MELNPTGPRKPGSRPGDSAPETLTPTPDLIIDALWKEVNSALTAQKDAKLPQDARLQAISEALYATQIERVRQGDLAWSMSTFVDTIWQNMPKDYVNKTGAVDMFADPFFAGVEGLMNNLQDFGGPDINDAAEMVAKEWMAEYEIQRDILQIERGEVAEAGKAHEKLGKVLGDHDRGMEAHPEAPTFKERLEKSNERREAQRERHILHGDLPGLKPGMAGLMPEQIDNVKKGEAKENKKKKEQELKEKKREEKDREDAKKKEAIEAKEKIAKEIETRAKEKAKAAEKKRLESRKEKPTAHRVRTTM